jgi:hypothetical protein
MRDARRCERRLLAGFLITRVDDLDDVQRVIEIRRGMLPLRGIQGKDRADRDVRNRRDVRIPGIKTGSRDQVSQPGDLLGAA